MLIMDLEVDNVFTGLCITVIVCVISTVLYYMFKHAVFAPTRSVTALLDSVSPKKKIKKPESKKAKKLKKQKQANESVGSFEQDLDRTHTSEETIDDEESISTDEAERKAFIFNANLPETDKTTVNELLAVKSAQEPPRVSPSVAMRDIPVCEAQESSAHPSLLSLSSSRKMDENFDFIQLPEVVAVASFEQPSQSPSESMQKTSTASKRPKKRNGKRITDPFKSASRETSHLVTNLINADQTFDVSEVVSKPTTSSSVSKEHIRSAMEVTSTESQEELRKLTDQLRATERKLEEVAQHASRLSEENEKLRAKEEEQTLGLHVLQNEYRELLRSNKSIEHEKSTKEAKLKTLEAERATLHARLDQATAESNRLRTQAEHEVRELRDQLAEGKAKLASMAAAMSSVPPPGPSPELVRAKEMVQAISSENCLLKARLEQLEDELNQLRQLSVLQTQQVQEFRAKTHKLRTEKETALEELRTQHQTDQTETKNRITSYETQIQRQHHELEVEQKRSQELMRNLNESQNELTRCLEREKRQSEVISSLKYQFAELNAQKQRLFEEVTQSMTLNDSTVNELRAQVASLSNDLARVNNELREARKRANNLENELESIRAASSANSKESIAPPEPHTDTGNCTDLMIASDDRAGDEQSPLPPIHLNATPIVEPESKFTISRLQQKLNTIQKDYQKAIGDLEEAHQQREAATMELQHYKITLVETERLLAKLQDCVAESEQKWRKLLANSETERCQLATRLEEANCKTKEISRKLKETERKLIAEKKEKSHSDISTDAKNLTKQPATKPSQHSAQNVDSVSTNSTEPNGLEVVAPQVDRVRMIEVTSPQCAEGSTASLPVPVDTNCATEFTNEPERLKAKDVKASLSSSPLRPPISPAVLKTRSAIEYEVVDDTWIALTSSRSLGGDQGPSPHSDGLLHVSARTVSGPRWASSLQELKDSQSGVPADADTDYDFDAVLVDDTDLHVPDDIWDTMTEHKETLSADLNSFNLPVDGHTVPTDQSRTHPISRPESPVDHGNSDYEAS